MDKHTSTPKNLYTKVYTLTSLTHLKITSKQPFINHITKSKKRQVKNTMKAITALQTSSKITYKGFTGNISEICRVFHKDYADTIRLAKTHCITDAIEKAKNRPRQIQTYEDVKALDNIILFPDFTLNDEQKEYAKKNINIVQDFIKNHNISDEDIQQNLYMQYLYAISASSHWNDEKPYQRRMIIRNNLSVAYTRFFRRQKRHDEMLISENTKTVIRERVDDFNDMLLKSYIHDMLIDIIRNLSWKEQAIIIRHYGLDGHDPESFKTIGDNMFITTSYASQIHQRALRKLRRLPVCQTLKGLI